MSAERKLKVGDEIWYFDSNHRVYTKPETYGGGQLIYREHWLKCTIRGETPRSWIIWGDKKIPKTGAHPGYAFTLQEVDDDCWINNHRSYLANAVREVTNADKLREIAKLVGYHP